MVHRRMSVAIAAVVIAAGGGALATSAIGVVQPTPAPFGAHRTYVEPAAPALPDGAYLGLIRALSPGDAIVAVDFVSLDEGVVEDHRPEQFVDAGVLGTVGFFSPVPTPFELRVEGDVIVAVQNADEELEQWTEHLSVVRP